MNMIKLTKIAESATPDFFSGQWKDYVPGKNNEGVSLPIEYWIKGALVKEPVVGESIFVTRTERNGEKCMGLFASTPIVEISQGEGNLRYIETKNSIYLLESVEETPN